MNLRYAKYVLISVSFQLLTHQAQRSLVLMVVSVRTSVRMKLRTYMSKCVYMCTKQTNDWLCRWAWWVTNFARLVFDSVNIYLHFWLVQSGILVLGHRLLDGREQVGKPGSQGFLFLLGRVGLVAIVLVLSGFYVIISGFAGRVRRGRILLRLMFRTFGIASVSNKWCTKTGVINDPYGPEDGLAEWIKRFINCLKS